MLVLGLGASGEDAARLLRSEGVCVTVFDETPSGERVKALAALGVTVVAAAKDHPIPSDVDLCVISPGIPLDHAWPTAVRERGIRIVPEFELGWSRLSGRVAAITGSNGKSTMAKWMAESLQAAGFSATVCGNYGPPVCRVAMEQGALDWTVIEVSSFQLEAAHQFRAEIGILLNVSPNHLDRHGSTEAYARAKLRLFSQALESDVCLAPTEWVSRAQAEYPAHGRWFTFGLKAGDAYYWREGRIGHQREPILDLRGTYFDNPVIGCNAAAVAGGLHAAGIPLEGAARAARAFTPLPHRMELVAEAKGIRFINDSKATTLAAVSAGLDMAGGPVRLIAGGLLKENDLSGVKEMLALRASGVYLIGKAAHQMAESWSKVVTCTISGTLEKAVEDACRDAREGDVILLSPGCASFDQFKNFEERGECFRRAANARAGEWTT